MQNQHTMTNLSTLLPMQKIPTPKPPPQREGTSRSFPINKTLCHIEGVARSISSRI
ncbi:hypothetical protein [Helicobacter macacae]|uniref:hypothetical protein n=1 Tax=Helicobacter macacae TaxID=398626 RepID=UPI0012EC69AB|nr:hypothetical protein [Helicobacter macacae]